MLENYPNHELFYTNGSKDAKAIGAGSHSSTENACCGLNPNASIFTAEGRAIEMVLDTITSSRHDRFLILSDSLSCLAAIKDRNIKSEGIKRILHKINAFKETGKEISFAWIPSHIGIKGNEVADQLAKIGLELDPSINKIPSTDFKTAINKYI